MTQNVQSVVVLIGISLIEDPSDYDDSLEMPEEEMPDLLAKQRSSQEEMC